MALVAPGDYQWDSCYIALNTKIRSHVSKIRATKWTALWPNTTGVINVYTALRSIEQSLYESIEASVPFLALFSSEKFNPLTIKWIKHRGKVSASTPQRKLTIGTSAKRVPQNRGATLFGISMLKRRCA